MNEYTISITDEFGAVVVAETTLDAFCTDNDMALDERIGIEADLWTSGEANIGGGAGPMFTIRALTVPDME